MCDTLLARLRKLVLDQDLRLSDPRIDPTDRMLIMARRQVYLDALDLAATIRAGRLLEVAEAKAKRLWRPPPLVWRDEIAVEYTQARAWQRIVNAGWPERVEVAPRWPDP